MMVVGVPPPASAVRGAGGGQAQAGLAPPFVAEPLAAPHSYTDWPNPVKIDAEAQTYWLRDDGLLSKPGLFTSPAGACYHAALNSYGLRSVRHPYRLRSCSFCGCPEPVLSDRRQ